MSSEALLSSHAFHRTCVAFTHTPLCSVVWILRPVQCGVSLRKLRLVSKVEKSYVLRLWNSLRRVLRIDLLLDILKEERYFLLLP